MRVVNLAGVKAEEMLCRRLSEWPQRSGSHETPRYKYGATTENADNWSPEPARRSSPHPDIPHGKQGLSSPRAGHQPRLVSAPGTAGISREGARVIFI